MLKKILFGLVAIIAVFVVIVSMRTADFCVSRSATLNAPAAAAFDQVNDFHKWGGWDPWAKLDPNAKSTFDGPPSGVGASMAWEGNNEVGKGKVTITESKPPERVSMRLEFEKPMKATNEAEFTFKADGSKTVVTWTMTGKNNFIGKAFGLFVDCDKMVGSQFEKGLASMKALAESAAKQ